MQLRQFGNSKRDYTERNCFPYTRMVRLKPAAPLARKWRFQGVFRIPEQHENILGAM